MHSIITILHVGSLLFISLFSLLSAFTSSFATKAGLCISSVILILVLLIKTKGFVRTSYTFFFLFSLVLSLIYDLPLEQIAEAIGSNADFILLFVFVPLIKIPIMQGNYMEQLLPIVRSMPKRKLYPVLVFTNFTFSSFLNFGGYRIVHEFFQDVMKNAPFLYGKILSRSFSLGAFWTPYFGAFSIAVAYSLASPASVILIGLLLSLLLLFIWSLLLYKKETEKPSAITTELPAIGRLFHLFIFFGLLIGSVILLNQLTDWNVLVIVSLMSSLISILWCLFLGKIKEFLQALHEFGNKELLMVREEAFLFISIGFLAETLLYLGWTVDIPKMEELSPWFLFMFIVLFGLLVIGLALIGVHHLVTITLINTSLNWQSMGIEPVVYALTILITWAICSMVSPFSPANLITSRITGKTAMEIGVKGNGPFGLVALLGGAAFLTVVHVVIRIGT